LPSWAQSAAGFPTGHALIPHANLGCGASRESAANRNVLWPAARSESSVIPRRSRLGMNGRYARARITWAAPSGRCTRRHAWRKRTNARVKILNANWAAGEDGDDGRFELMIVTADDRQHLAVSAPDR
jgi:hypothetical protein